MRGIRPLYWILFGLGMALLCYAFVQDDTYKEARTIRIGASDFKELSSRFESLAEQKGAEYAFEVLRRATLPPNTDIHLLGHVVGEVLYEQQGINGIAVCTQDFRNACSHSVVIGALGEFGPDALPDIREACLRAPGGGGAYTMCFHGLGHGVFAYYGYSFPETIAFCRMAGTKKYDYQEFSQCVGGAVMELMGGGGHDTEGWLRSREMYLRTDEPLAPCDTSLIPDEAKPLCLIYLTPRLFELAGADLGMPDQGTFSKAFSFCEQIPESDVRLRGACFGGFGKEFIVLAGQRDIRSIEKYSDSTLSQALLWCSIPTRGEDKDACTGDAVSSVFWGGENDEGVAFRFCALAKSSQKHACFERLAADTMQYVREEERRTALCAHIQSESGVACHAL